MPTLNWIGKDKIVNHDKEVAFRLLKKNIKLSLGKSSENLIVEGDNLEALKALMPFYYGKVKCIYIDPPYNTGNEGWVYNDRVNAPKIKEWLGKAVGAEGEDLLRHDKWLCMMYPRLKLLYDLLREDGTIFISIDDNEHCNLRMAMDEIFGEENFVANFIWKSKGSGAYDTKAIKVEHEYILCYAKNVGLASFAQIPFDTSSDDQYRYSDKRLSFAGRYKRQAMAMGTLTYSIGLDYPLINPDGAPTFPGGKKGKPFIWRWNKEKLEKAIKNGFAEWIKTRNGWSLYSKQYERLDSEGNPIDRKIQKTTVITDLLSRNGTQELQDVFNKKVFAYPKPSVLIKDFIRLSTAKDDIVLDSFAGSGTTAHAVLDLNKEDGGNRRFILVQMIEDKKNIARDITAERVRRVAKKFGSGSFEYLELDGPLFDAQGIIASGVKFDDLAQYIFFTETHTSIKKVTGNYLGESGGVHYFLFFGNAGGNVLDKKSAAAFAKISGPKVVYADKALIDEATMEKYQITFKQIPYGIKIY